MPQRGFQTTRSCSKKRGKDRVEFVCEECGANHVQWSGKCSACGTWGSLKEFKVAAPAAGTAGGFLDSVRSQGGASPIGKRSATFKSGQARNAPQGSWNFSGDGLGGLAAGTTEAGRLEPLLLANEHRQHIAGNSASGVSSGGTSRAPQESRLPSGEPELDRVLGGGLTKGSLTLLAGSPGVGKSTLALQLAIMCAAKRPGATAVYLSGEESVGQVRDKAMRLSAVLGDDDDHNDFGGGHDKQGADGGTGSGMASFDEVHRPRRGGVGRSALAGVSAMNEPCVEDALDAVLGVLRAGGRSEGGEESGSESEEEESDGEEAGQARGGGGAGSTTSTGGKGSNDWPSVSVLVVDSIQTMFSRQLESSPGSVTQVRECSLRLLQLAKATGIPVLLVGHVTKSGEVAGPKVLEHLVDTVIQLEGEAAWMGSGGGGMGMGGGGGEGGGGASTRLLRATKNRFGSTDEVGVLTMTGGGLVPVDNPAELFLSLSAPEDDEAEDGATKKPRLRSIHSAPRMRNSGVAVAAPLEGTRPLLVEVQALVAQAAGEYPRHRSHGLALDRLHLLLAVLGKHAGLFPRRGDVLFNVVGGLRLRDPSTDLAAAAAVASSLLDVPLPGGVACIGEVGLGGEVRRVPAVDARLRAASALGFQWALVPASGPPRHGGSAGGETGAGAGAGRGRASGQVQRLDGAGVGGGRKSEFGGVTIEQDIAREIVGEGASGAELAVVREALPEEEQGQVQRGGGRGKGGGKQWGHAGSRAPRLGPGGISVYEVSDVAEAVQLLTGESVAPPAAQKKRRSRRGLMNLSGEGQE